MKKFLFSLTEEKKDEVDDPSILLFRLFSPQRDDKKGICGRNFCSIHLRILEHVAD